VGNRQGYKNFDLTMRAFSLISDRFRDVDLLLAGAEIADFELKAMTELGIADRVHPAGRVDDSQLAKLYAQSVALIYPSLSEGFGIPPLEAMICGTVPIVSNCSSMPEVVGDAGLLIDPKHAESLADAMERIMNQSFLREALLRKAFDRAKLFSWDRTVELIFNAWREASRK
jgi:glycosyltransferase involved in cell wall biosynthesis